LTSTRKWISPITFSTLVALPTGRVARAGQAAAGTRVAPAAGGSHVLVAAAVTWTAATIANLQRISEKSLSTTLTMKAYSNFLYKAINKAINRFLQNVL